MSRAILLNTNMIILLLLCCSFWLFTNAKTKIPLFNLKKISNVIASGGIIASSSVASVAWAFGPSNFELQIKSYQQVELCNGKKPIMPGQKAAEGLYPVCIEVIADVINSDKKSVNDAGVYGFVKEDAAGNSVLPNNPDFKSDAGQYAMIKEIPPGKSSVTYQFVAAVSANPKTEPIPKLTFLKTKAVSYPGGDKFKPLDECEIDPRADGCSDD